MRKSVEEKKLMLIAEFAAARSEVLAEIKAVPVSEADAIFMGVWSIKDLLAHLIGWDFTNLLAIQEILAGVYPTFFGFYDKDWHTYNSSLVQKYKRGSISDLVSDAQNSHHSLVALLESLPARTVLEAKASSEKGRTVTIRRLLSAETRDELTHAEQVKTYRSPC